MLLILPRFDIIFINIQWSHKQKYYYFWNLSKFFKKRSAAIHNRERILISYFLLLFVSVVWKTLEADMRFSIYCPRTWFSDFSFRFSSFTASTLAERSILKIKKHIVDNMMAMFLLYKMLDWFLENTVLKFSILKLSWL